MQLHNRLHSFGAKIVAVNLKIFAKTSDKTQICYISIFNVNITVLTPNGIQVIFMAIYVTKIIITRFAVLYLIIFFVLFIFYFLLFFIWSFANDHYQFFPCFLSLKIFFVTFYMISISFSSFYIPLTPSLVKFTMVFFVSTSFVWFSQSMSQFFYWFLSLCILKLILYMAHIFLKVCSDFSFRNQDVSEISIKISKLCSQRQFR